MTTRRDFIPLAAGAALVAQAAPSDRLNIAAVGIGGVGASYLQGLQAENIMALCDVDDAVAARTFARYPAATRYRDYRRMLEKEKSIDAVVIATPDHSHAAIATAAMQLGKHVYCAKPLTRTIREARALAQLAREKKVATQMSVQSCNDDMSCTTIEWIRGGVAGKVREVHVWSDRPVWPHAVVRPEPAAIPAGLDWDLWLAGAPKRPYSPVYHPFHWRGWYDFGTGAIGDMGCHTLHVIVRALELSSPLAVSASNVVRYVSDLSVPMDKFPPRARKDATPETFPAASIVTWEFAGGVRVTWYDGGLKPPRPAEWDPAKPMPGSGILFVGDKQTIFSKFTGTPSLIPEREFAGPPKTMTRTKEHYAEFAAAAKGGPAAACEFGFGSLLTEITLLGTIAQRTGKYLRWDAAAMRFTNESAANQLVG